MHRVHSLLFAAIVSLAAPSWAGDWAPWSDIDVIQVVTTRPDGVERTTSIWIVVVDGNAYIRGNATSDWGNEVDAAATFRLIGGDETRTVTGERVPHGARYERVEAAYREKYGFQDALISLFRGDARIWSIHDAP